MDGIIISIQNKPNIEELREFLTIVYNDLDPLDSARFSNEQIQELDQWISLDEMMKYSYGKLIEARNSEGKLVGALYLGKDNPIAWPDGNKAEVFLLGPFPSERGKGIGSGLMKKAEDCIWSSVGTV